MTINGFDYMNIGPIEIALFLGIVMLLFGPDKIPDLARSVGRATREYQKALTGVQESGENLMSEMKGDQNTLGGSAPTSQTNAQEDRGKQIMEQAQLLGIPTEGKTIDQVVDEILARSD